MATKKITTQLYSQTGEKLKSVELNAEVFGVEPKESVVHQVAVAQMANKRTPIAHTKTRAEVRGGGIKPWRQKGTGRARHGSIRSPLWVGGGVTFGPTKDRNFSKKVNKKQKIKALFMCLSDKVNSDLLTLLDKFEIKDGKTKEIVETFENLNDIIKLEKNKTKSKTDKDTTNKNKSKFDIKDYKLSLLIILPESDRKLFNAGRNLPGVKVTTADSLNVIDLLKYKQVMIIEKGLKVIENTYTN